MKRKQERWLGIDVGSRHVGFAIAHGRDIIECGTYNPNGNQVERLTKIFEWMEIMLAREPPDVVAVEEPCGNHGNPKTDRLLGGVFWAVRIAAQRAGVETIAINPQQVKASGASKENTRWAAALVEERDVSPDEADAIGTILAGHKLRGYRVN